MLENYLPILIFIGAAVGLGMMIIMLGWLVSPYRPSKEKRSAYECGFPVFEDARMPFNVRFYLVAILFIIFDLETAFMFPWAVVLRHIGIFGLVSMAIFIALLAVGFVFEWRRGALEWE